MKNQSNDLRYTATKTVGNEVITVKIRLNDECKNGHQDFAITGEIYAAGKPRNDRNMISAGCIHEDIAKHFPEFIPFIKLHLCDYSGTPMHCIANGYYHLTNGFNSKATGDIFAAEYCEYYRITPEQFNVLKDAKNQVQYAEYLVKLGILDQWKNEANAAIKILEDLTGMQFVNDSQRSQYIPPTPEEIAEEETRQKEGYYTPEAEAQRAKKHINSLLGQLVIDKQTLISKAEMQFSVKKEVLLKGGEKALKNCIYYGHTKEVAFNWMSYDKLPTEFINDLIGKLNLPDGVTAKISTNK